MMDGGREREEGGQGWRPRRRGRVEGVAHPNATRVIQKERKRGRKPRSHPTTLPWTSLLHQTQTHPTMRDQEWRARKGSRPRTRFESSRPSDGGTERTRDATTTQDEDIDHRTRSNHNNNTDASHTREATPIATHATARWRPRAGWRGEGGYGEGEGPRIRSTFFAWDPTGMARTGTRGSSRWANARYVPPRRNVLASSPTSKVVDPFPFHPHPKGARSRRFARLRLRPRRRKKKGEKGKVDPALPWTCALRCALDRRDHASGEGSIGERTVPVSTE